MAPPADVRESPGVQRRSDIDNELVKGLLLANGGGAVALLAFLKVVFDTQDLRPLAIYVVYALIAFHIGVATALVHNHYRTRCSLIYDQHNFRPPPGKLFGKLLNEPRECRISKIFRWGSLALFTSGGLIVAFGALRLLLCT